MAAKEQIGRAVKPVPDGYHTVTPYLTVTGAARLIDFLKAAFDATDIELMSSPDGTVQHAELKIGDSVVMIGEAQGPWKPQPTHLYLYVNDADATYRRALAAGATSVREVADQFYGDRSGGVQDPSGNVWWVASRIENLSKEELTRRAQAMHAKQPPQ